MPVAAILFDRENIHEKESISQFLEITYSKIKILTEEIYFFSEKEISIQGIKNIYFKSVNDFLDFMTDCLKDKSIMILNAYSPLLDVESTKKMLAEHQEYVFDFTYPENIPLGLLPEIIEGNVAGFIKDTIPEGTGMFINSIKELFERDISSYDCNIFISECKIIKYRVNFIPDNFNDFLILKDIIERNAKNYNITQLEEMIGSNPSIIRKRPTYFEIELNTERESGEFFIGDKLSRNINMKIEDFENIVNQVSSFSKNPVVNIGLFGEPFLYPEIERIIDIIANYKQIQFLFESRCCFMRTEMIEKAIVLPNVKIIFDISFAGNDNFSKYKKPLNPIIPIEDLESIEDKIKSLPDKEKIYIQFTRSTLNENEIMKFYEKWRDFSDRIIIKKLDTFGGLLEKYRVVDLSPIKRFACLHLKHDMIVFANGDVPLCRQDYNGLLFSNNLLKDGIEKCWENLLEPYCRHWKGDFESPLLCRNCDEWWVFNF